MKAMLSQPMAGKTDEEIIQTRERAIGILQEKGYEIVNTLFTDEWYDQENMKKRGVVQIPLCFLAKSLENMSLCHAAYFCKGWEKARGCRLEHEAAVAYGLDIIYEERVLHGNKRCGYPGTIMAGRPHRKTHSNNPVSDQRWTCRSERSENKK